jgi:hypothetical protein
MSKRELDNINNQIILPRRIMYQLSTTYTKKRNEIAYLQNQIQALQSQSLDFIVKSIKNSINSE